MDSIPPGIYLIGVIVCSLIGRLMLVKAAFGVSQGWGLTVMLVPFGPFFFRRKYKDIATAGQHWRTATTLFAVAFLLLGSGDVEGEMNRLFNRGEKTDLIGQTMSDDPEGDDEDGHEFTAAVTAGATAAPATPLTAALTPEASNVSTVERVAANQREFLRLNQVYEDLKKERGYLRKNNAEDLAAYNAAAAKYQAELAAARAEQAELNRQLTVARK